MNKRNSIIYYIFIITLGIAAFLLFYKINTDIIITLDINPSIELRVDKNDNVKSIKALNEDAKLIINDEMKNKSFQEVMNIVVENMNSKNMIREGNLTILMNVSGKETNDYDRQIEEAFSNHEVNVHVVVPVITESAKKLSKELGITEAKAAYIEETIEKEPEVKVEDLANKSVNEIEETKNTGRYCDKDYNLEGNMCVKAIGEETPVEGKICSHEYLEYNGKCYEEVPADDSDELKCHDDFELKDGQCVRSFTREAEPSKYECSKGELKTVGEIEYRISDSKVINDRVCLDYSTATHPVTPCELPASDPTERTSSGGRCYWHRAPVIESGCPGKIQIGNYCWDDATNVYICQGYRDGKQYKSKDEYCEHTINYIKPTVTEYKCQEEDFTLNGTTCEKIETEDAWHEKVCPSGYTKVNNDRCINLNNSIDMVDGYRCQSETARYEDNTCIIYEFIESKGN